jgi:hypothetical protein
MIYPARANRATEQAPNIERIETEQFTPAFCEARSTSHMGSCGTPSADARKKMAAWLRRRLGSSL